MTEQPPWGQAVSPEEQRKIDEQIAANMGITLEELYEIDKQVMGDVKARDAVPQNERTVDGNPKFNKGFGPATPENTIQPGEIRAYYDAAPSDRGAAVMPDSGWTGGPPEHPAPSAEFPRADSGSSGGNFFDTPRDNYDAWTRQPVFYYPVTLRGALLGYLYASVTHNSASFLRNLPSQAHYDPFSDPSLEAGSVWYNRLKAAYAKGLSAQDAVRSWVGAPADPEGGGIAAGAAEGRSETLESLNQSLNPGGPPMQNPLIQDGTYPDGTPVDRSQGWGPLIGAPVRRYPVETAGGVRFYPVTKEGGVLGWVWASFAGDGADYLPYGRAGRFGEIAGGWWQLWLSKAFEAGYTPLEALEYCRSQPENSTAGVIGPDAPVGEFQTLAQLKNYARQ